MSTWKLKTSATSIAGAFGDCVKSLQIKVSTGDRDRVGTLSTIVQALKYNDTGQGSVINMVGVL